jgi:biopolymer transport protein ExbB/TolQ
MSLYNVWIENDWVVKLMILAVFVVIMIVFEKSYQLFKSYKSLQGMKKLSSLNAVESLEPSKLKEVLVQINAFEGQRVELFDANIGVKLDILESYLMRFVSVLGLIAILSPMLGLIGTFLGVWHVFEGVSQVNLNDPSVIAKGIKEVLIDTMAGLIVAVIAMIFYKSYEIIAQKMVTSFEEQLYILLKQK